VKTIETRIVTEKKWKIYAISASALIAGASFVTHAVMHAGNSIPSESRIEDSATATRHEPMQFIKKPELSPHDKTSAKGGAHGRDATDQSPYLSNSAYKHGMKLNEAESASFLNRSSFILNKPIRTLQEDLEIKRLLSSTVAYDAISQHYINEVPDKFLFAEEITRIKMIEFITAALELSENPNRQKLEMTIEGIVTLPIAEISDLEVRRSLAGDVLQLLGATRNKASDIHSNMLQRMTASKTNLKILAFLGAKISSEN